MKLSTAALSIALGILGFCLPRPTQAQGWSVDPCAATGAEQEARKGYVAKVRAADPDTPLFTPNVLPTSDKQILENFVSYHTAAFEDVPFEKLPDEEQELFSAMRENRLRYSVVRVVNWTPLRCGVPKARREWSVLRLFEKETGIELGRVSIDEIGHVGKLRHRPADGELSPIPELLTAEERLRGAAGNVKDAQYVSTWGTLLCDELVPCVAARRGRDIYIVDSRTNGIFVVHSDASPMSFRTDLAAPRRAAFLEQVRQAGQRLVSLGGDRLAFARPVEKPNGSDP